MNGRKIAALGAAILVLTGCSATPTVERAEAPASSPPVAEPNPTPTIDPGPVELTIAQAGDRYLGIMCARNAAVEEVGAAFAAQEDAYWADETTNVENINASARRALEASRVTIELLDDPYFVWPDGVAEHLQVLRASVMEDAPALDTWANADSVDEAMQTDWGSGDDAATSAQEVRYLLDLPADTTSSCEGMRGEARDLRTEMVEREEYLAEFAPTN